MMTDISEVANVLDVTVARGTAELYVPLSEKACAFWKVLKAGIGKKRLILRVPGKLYLDL